MFAALSLACGDAFAPGQRRALLLSIGLSLALLVGLWLGATALVAGIAVSAIGWINDAVRILGSLAALFIAWTLFPAMMLLVLGFFLDSVVTSVERAHYPELGPARPIGIGEIVISGLRLAILALVINLLALPLYFVPAVGLVLYYLLNGYLVGRQYFELVALRRVDRRAMLALWHEYRARLILAGAIVAFLLSLPVIDLAAPVIGAAFMLHLFEGLRRRIR